MWANGIFLPWQTMVMAPPKQIQFSEIQKLNYRITETKLQDYRSTNYRRTEIQITEINTNYRNTEIQITKIQKYLLQECRKKNYRITEKQVKIFLITGELLNYR